MKRLLRKICSGFYSIVKHFPSSSSRFGGGISNFLRRLAIRGIVRKCGKGVTIEKNAEIPASLEIGDYRHREKLSYKRTMLYRKLCNDGAGCSDIYSKSFA